MAAEWGYTLQGKRNDGESGSRDVLIIAQDDCIQGPDIQPRSSLELTESDKNQLQRLGVSLANWQDDVSIMAARCSSDMRHTLLPTERSKPGNALSKKYVLSKIENSMKTTMKAGCK